MKRVTLVFVKSDAHVIPERLSFIFLPCHFRSLIEQHITHWRVDVIGFESLISSADER